MADLVWILRDKTTPSWDQSHYLYMTWVYRHDLDWHGLHAMLHDLNTIDPGRGPMLSILLIPISYFTDADPFTGLVLNIILWPILLLSASGIAAHFYGQRARWLTVLLAAPLPILVSLSHTTLQDFLLATLSTLSVWLLLRTKRFSRPVPSAVLGIVFMIGVLTKLSFPLGIAVPFLVVLVQAALDLWQGRGAVPLRSSLRLPVVCIVVFTVLAAVVPVLWYIKEWTPTVAYLHEAFAQQPGVLKDPTSFQNLGDMVLSTFNASISWQIAIVAAVAIAIRLVQVRRFSLRFTLPSIENFVFLFSWVAIPYLAVAISDNHGDRYAVASFPAGAVILAGCIARISFAPSRRFVVGLAVIAAFTMTMQVESASWRFPGLADDYIVSTRFGPAEIQLAAGVGPATNPLSQDYAANVMNYLVRLARLRSGKIRPLDVTILELQGYVNGNTMPYEAIRRHLPFTFTTLLYTNQKTLIAQLKQSDIALYLTQPGQANETKYGRVAELNNTAAAYYMTPADFRLFEPNPHTIFVGQDSGQGDEMEVLVRKH